LTAEQFANGAIYASLLVPARPGTPPHSIQITAKERNSTTARTLVVKAGSTIMIENSTPDLALARVEARDPNAGHPEHGHFALYAKMINGMQTCTAPPARRPCGPEVPSVTQVGGGVTGEIGCSNTGCCKP
jgi:hypothetical protein